MKRVFVLIFAVLGFSMLGACASNTGPTTRPALMDIPAKEGTADYWLNQPGAYSVTSPDFYILWKACTQTLLWDQFQIDEQDQRLGILTTYPVISKQFFEPWRSDGGTIGAILIDSLQTTRRTVRFDIARRWDGTFIATPKVLVEQSSHPERRITAQAQFTQAFLAVAEQPTRTNELGVEVPNRYWFALGRDEEMEGQLARAVRGRIGGNSEVRNLNDESSPKSE
jgi:hypothetical protein